MSLGALLSRRRSSAAAVVATVLGAGAAPAQESTLRLPEASSNVVSAEGQSVAPPQTRTPKFVYVQAPLGSPLQPEPPGRTSSLAQSSVSAPQGSLGPQKKQGSIALAAISGLIAVPGYLLALRRGTPVEKRLGNPIYRALDRIYPETKYFPNNRATWVASAVNSSALFGLGILQALADKTGLYSALTSQAIVGVYAAGAGALAIHSLRNRSSSQLGTVDKLCLSGALAGVAMFISASLSRMGYFPPVQLPLEGIGIALGITVRALALTPLTREFYRCGREAFHPALGSHGRSLPSLSAHWFWNGAIILNLMNLPSLSSKAALVPGLMTGLNMVTLGVGLWAWNRQRRAGLSSSEPKQN